MQIFSFFLVFVQMLTRCWREQWSYSVREVSGSWNLFSFPLRWLIFTVHVGLESHVETLKTFWWVKTSHPTCCGRKCLVGICWQRVDELFSPSWKKNLKKTFEPWDFILPTLLFFFLCLKCCNEFQCWSFLCCFCQLKLHWGWWRPPTERRVDNPDSDVGFTNSR